MTTKQKLLNYLWFFILEFMYFNYLYQIANVGHIRVNKLCIFLVFLPVTLRINLTEHFRIIEEKVLKKS